MVDKKEKVKVLLELLKERCIASHKMRERSLQFTLWILGFLLAIIGWLWLNSSNLILSQKILMTLLIILTGAVSYYFLISIEKGFNRNRKIMTKLETSLDLYKKNSYIKNDTIYPDEYRNTKKSINYHFISLYVLILVTIVILIFFIWTKQSDRSNSTNKEIKNSIIIKKDGK